MGSLGDSSQTTNSSQQFNNNSTANQTGTTNTSLNQSQNGATSSATNPWATALPTVNGILSQLNPLISNSGLTSPQQTAIQQLTASCSSTAFLRLSSLAPP